MARWLELNLEEMSGELREDDVYYMRDRIQTLPAAEVKVFYPDPDERARKLSPMRYRRSEPLTFERGAGI